MKIVEKWLGKNFLKGDTFIDFLRDALRLGTFLFSPWIILAIALVIENLFKLL